MPYKDAAKRLLKTGVFAWIGKRAERNGEDLLPQRGAHAPEELIGLNGDSEAEERASAFLALYIDLGTYLTCKPHLRLFPPFLIPPGNCFPAVTTKFS